MNKKTSLNMIKEANIKEMNVTNVILMSFNVFKKRVVIYVQPIFDNFETTFSK
jgi:hypothetical protein